MPSKKDLEQIFGVSDNTVYKTLKACGLDTAKEDYSDEEIENFFKPARQMLDAQKTYKDVEERFQTKNVAEENQHNQYDSQSASASDAVGIATAEMAADLVQGAVKQISPFIPQLVAHTLAEEMRSPEMRQAFEETRSQMRAQNTGNAGADFLLQKMNGMSAQLGGSSPNQAQLPEAPQE